MCMCIYMYIYLSQRDDLTARKLDFLNIARRDQKRCADRIYVEDSPRHVWYIEFSENLVNRPWYSLEIEGRITSKNIARYTVRYTEVATFRARFHDRQCFTRIRNITEAFCRITTFLCVQWFVIIPAAAWRLFINRASRCPEKLG